MLHLEASRFGQAALRGGLIASSDLEAYWSKIPPEKRTIDRIDRYLARQAVEAGKITLWQAQQLIQGRWQGIRVGPYVIRDLIGQGGMGRVYLARHEQSGRLLALKVLARHRRDNPRALARFVREARIGTQLSHDNLVKIHEIGQYKGVPYLVMHYVPGPTLASLIEKHRQLPTTIAAEIIRQAARGLQHLHQKGMLHRDITPSNILMEFDGTSKLADLGLALDLDDPEVLTRDGATIGTLDYISPEQARNSRSIDIRSDIYGLGCILYQAIAGELVFPMPSLSQRMMAHQLSVTPSLLERVPECPPELDDIVLRMLKKRPDDRYASPADVAEALAPFASGPPALREFLADYPTRIREETADRADQPAHIAIWFDSDQDTPAVSPVHDLRDADVFPIEKDPQDQPPLQPPNPPADADPIDPNTANASVSRSWLDSPLAALVFIAILAILAFLVSRWL